LGDGIVGLYLPPILPYGFGQTILSNQLSKISIKSEFYHIGMLIAFSDTILIQYFFLKGELSLRGGIFIKNPSTLEPDPDNAGVGIQSEL